MSFRANQKPVHVTWVWKYKPIRVTHNEHPGVSPGVEIRAGIVHAETANCGDDGTACPAHNSGD